MAASVNKYRRELQVLCRASPSVRKALLASADPGLTECLVECAYNCLRGNVALNHVQKKKLSRHRKLLRALIKPGETWKHKRAKLVQQGGALLPLLIGPILSAVLSSVLR